MADALNVPSPDQIESYHGIVGRSDAFKAVINTVEKISKTDTSVLIQGETGTGKSLVARAIHECSARSDKPFCVINLGAFPESLVESELFGHQKGAFTGADTDRPGALARAAGGTLLLDEISKLPLPLQVKFLWALEGNKYHPLGSSESRNVEARFIATSYRDLAEEVKADRFREDLYYRLNVVQIVVPPLRERVDDIPPLLQYFASKFATEFKRSVRQISGEELESLLAYEWPGNVRELRSTVERALLASEGTTIHIRLPEGIDALRTSGDEPVADVPSFGFLLDPGSATPHELAKLFTEISLLYRKLGGNGLQFTVTDCREPTFAEDVR